ncbi:hypothetical protein BD413DRAFT_472713 [Trametes elegans]|nr:hypothetical protein BD413DRAFT_472713 [Trametes elegans]
MNNGQANEARPNPAGDLVPFAPNTVVTPEDYKANQERIQKIKAALAFYEEQNNQGLQRYHEEKRALEAAVAEGRHAAQRLAELSGRTATADTSHIPSVPVAGPSTGPQPHPQYQPTHTTYDPVEVPTSARIVEISSPHVDGRPATSGPSARHDFHYDSQGQRHPDTRPFPPNVQQYGNYASVGVTNPMNLQPTPAWSSSIGTAPLGPDQQSYSTAQWTYSQQAPMHNIGIHPQQPLPTAIYQAAPPAANLSAREPQRPPPPQLLHSAGFTASHQRRYGTNATASSLDGALGAGPSTTSESVPHAKVTYSSRHPSRTQQHPAETVQSAPQMVNQLRSGVHPREEQELFDFFKRLSPATVQQLMVQVLTVVERKKSGRAKSAVEEEANRVLDAHLRHACEVISERLKKHSIVELKQLFIKFFNILKLGREQAQKYSASIHNVMQAQHPLPPQASTSMQSRPSTVPQELSATSQPPQTSRANGSVPPQPSAAQAQVVPPSSSSAEPKMASSSQVSGPQTVSAAEHPQLQWYVPRDTTAPIAYRDAHGQIRYSYPPAAMGSKQHTPVSFQTAVPSFTRNASQPTQSTSTVRPSGAPKAAGIRGSSPWTPEKADRSRLAQDIMRSLGRPKGPDSKELKHSQRKSATPMLDENLNAAADGKRKASPEPRATPPLKRQRTEDVTPETVASTVPVPVSHVSDVIDLTTSTPEDPPLEPMRISTDVAPGQAADVVVEPAKEPVGEPGGATVTLPATIEREASAASSDTADMNRVQAMFAEPVRPESVASESPSSPKSSSPQRELADVIDLPSINEQLFGFASAEQLVAQAPPPEPPSDSDRTVSQSPGRTKVPLFLPSPSSSPPGTSRSQADSEVLSDGEAAPRALYGHKSKGKAKALSADIDLTTPPGLPRARRRREVFVEVPPLPEYAMYLKEAGSANASASVSASGDGESGTYSCRWQTCSHKFSDEEKLARHVRKHAMLPLPCAYEGCDKTFNTVEMLLAHHHSNRHRLGALRRSTAPFAPVPLPRTLSPLPEEVPAYLSITRRVARHPISKERHQWLGPKVLESVTAFKYSGGRSHVAHPARSRRLAEKVAAASELASNAPNADVLAQIRRWTDGEYAAFADGYDAARRPGLRCADIPSREVTELVDAGLVLWPAPDEDADDGGDAADHDNADANAGPGAGDQKEGAEARARGGPEEREAADKDAGEARDDGAGRAAHGDEADARDQPVLDAADGGHRPLGEQGASSGPAGRRDAQVQGAAGAAHAGEGAGGGPASTATRPGLKRTPPRRSIQGAGPGAPSLRPSASRVVEAGRVQRAQSAPSSRCPPRLYMPRPARTPSLSAAHPRTRTMQALPSPGYISARSAEVILSDVRPIKLKPEALQSINLLLDEFLYSILAVARSLTTDAIKAALLKVLPTSLGKEALLEAEVELKAYWERTTSARSPAASARNGDGPHFDLQWSFELLRLKCEAYSTMNDSDEDAEAERRLQQRMEAAGSSSPPNPSLLAPAALYLTAILECVPLPICLQHVLSNVSRVAARDSARTLATIQDLFTALGEDDALYGSLKSMKVYEQIKTLAEAQRPRRSKSFTRGTEKAPNATRTSTASPTPSKARMSTDSIKSNAPTVVGSNESRRTSMEKAKAGKIFHMRSLSDRERHEPADAGPLARSPSEMAINNRDHGEFEVSPRMPEDEELQQEFDELMRSGATMKVSLTPDRLKSMEVYKQERTDRGSRRAGQATENANVPDGGAPIATGEPKRGTANGRPALRHVDSIVEDDEEGASPNHAPAPVFQSNAAAVPSASVSASAAASRMRNTSFTASPSPLMVQATHQRLRSISISNVPHPRYENGVGRKTVAKAAASSSSRMGSQNAMPPALGGYGAGQGGAPKRTRKMGRNRESLDLDDVMNGSDGEDAGAAAVPVAEPPVPVSTGPVPVPPPLRSPPPPRSPDSLSPRKPHVSRAAQDLIAFLEAGPPEEPAYNPAMNASVISFESSKTRSGRLQRMMSRLTLSGSKEGLNGAIPEDGAAPSRPQRTLSRKNSSRVGLNSPPPSFKGSSLVAKRSMTDVAAAHHQHQHGYHQQQQYPNVIVATPPPRPILQTAAAVLAEPPHSTTSSSHTSREDVSSPQSHTPSLTRRSTRKAVPQFDDGSASASGSLHSRPASVRDSDGGSLASPSVRKSVLPLSGHPVRLDAADTSLHPHTTGSGSGPTPGRKSPRAHAKAESGYASRSASRSPVTLSERLPAQPPSSSPQPTPALPAADVDDLRRLMGAATSADECRLLVDMFLARNGFAPKPPSSSPSATADADGAGEASLALGDALALAMRGNDEIERGLVALFLDGGAARAEVDAGLQVGTGSRSGSAAGEQEREHEHGRGSGSESGRDELEHDDEPARKPRPAPVTVGPTPAPALGGGGSAAAAAAGADVALAGRQPAARGGARGSGAAP